MKMITAFRRIRKSLLDSNSTRRYFLYAIGEILLVMIGILLALQVNNWNQQRNNDRKAKVYIDRLINDLRADSAMWVRHISDASLKASHCDYIRKVVDDQSNLSDTAEFVLILQAVGRLDLTPVSNNTFQDLQGSGNLNLIKDHHTSEAIRNYYNAIPYWWFDQYSKQLVEGYLPLAVDAIPLRIHKMILSEELSRPGDSSLFPNARFLNVSADDFETILNYINDNDDFDYNLKRINRSHRVHTSMLTGMSHNANGLIQTLEKFLLTI